MSEETGKGSAQKVSKVWDPSYFTAPRQRLIPNSRTEKILPEGEDAPITPPSTLFSRFYSLWFYLFPRLKEKLKGRTFGTEKELDSAISRVLKKLSENGFFEVFR